MNQDKSFPKLKELDYILEDIKAGKTRSVLISYSHGYRKIISNKIQIFQMPYNVLLFSNLINDEPSVLKETHSGFFNIFKLIYQFIIDLNPVIALINLFSNIALESFGYYLKKTDVHTLTKQLKAKRKPRKHKKVKTIILVEELANLTKENINYLDFIGYLIEKGHVRSTALIILSDKEFCPDVIIAKTNKIDLDFTEDDYVFYTGTTANDKFLINIIESIGVEYIDKIHDLFKSTGEKQIKSIAHLIRYLIDSVENRPDTEKIEYFLKICSFLFDEFKLFDIEELDKNLSLHYKETLPVSLKSKVLKETATPNIFSFAGKPFKNYFLTLAPIILERSQVLYIMDYLKKEYPEHYVDLALAAKVMPLQKGEQLSYFIIAYYNKKNQKLRYIDLIIEFLSNTDLGKSVIKLESYRSEIESISQDDIKFEANMSLDIMIRYKGLSVEAKLCTLSFVADVLYETEQDQDLLLEIFELYMSLFYELRIYEVPQDRYVDYVLDAITFSTCLEKYSVQKRVNRLVEWVNKREIADVEKKIKFYRLGNLLYTLNMKSAVNFTRSAFEISTNNIILHEEARINYSVSLMGLGEYKKAYTILKDCKTVSSDYKNALENNTIVSGILSGENSKHKTMVCFEKLANKFVNSLSSDGCIIMNNYLGTLLMNDATSYHDKIEDLASKIIDTKDIYHMFFALHHLLILYYLDNNSCMFEEIKSQIKLPYLMRQHSVLLKNKIQLLDETFGQFRSLYELENHLTVLSDSSYYSNSLLIAPIIWGLMERWFK